MRANTSVRPVPKVLVAVVSFNTRDLLARCLESMAVDERLEVWVVDNASTDGSAEMVRERFPWVNLIASEENLGFGRAVNEAVRHGSQTAWIAPANADIALEPGTIDALLAAPGDAVAPRLVLPDGSTQQSVLPFPTLRFTLLHNLGLSRERQDWALGAFLMVRREAWPGFDEAQWMYAEDLDLGWRLRGAGFELRYVPEARVLHESAASTSVAFGDQIEARWQRATYEWMLRRRGRAVTRAVAAVNVAGALARAAMPWREPWRRERSRRWARTHAIGLRVRLR
jgi:GT2 family glycosyltransferase